MKRQLRAGATRRGYAIVVVLTVIVMMGIYLVAAGTAFDTQVRQGSMHLERAERARATAGALERARASAEGQADLLAAGGTGRAEWRLLAADDPTWADLPGMAARPDDRLLTVTWTRGRLKDARERFLLNPARRGAIRLAEPAATAAVEQQPPAAQ